MSRENNCMNYPWYCADCDEEWFDADIKIWKCPYDDAIPTLPVLEADVVHFMEED